MSGVTPLPGNPFSVLNEKNVGILLVREPTDRVKDVRLVAAAITRYLDGLGVDSRSPEAIARHVAGTYGEELLGEMEPLLGLLVAALGPGSPEVSEYHEFLRYFEGHMAAIHAQEVASFAGRTVTHLLGRATV